jgi:hypothetical protein
MFKSQQYRAEAAEYGELVRSSTGPDESRKFQERQDRLASLADNEQGLADSHDRGGNPMSLTQVRVDDGPHNMDGLRLLAQDGTERVEAFIGRKVMDVWPTPSSTVGEDKVCSMLNTMHLAS